MKVKFFVRSSQPKGKKKKVDYSIMEPVYCRVADRGILDQKAKTNIQVASGIFNNKIGSIDPKVLIDANERISLISAMTNLSAYIVKQFEEADKPIPQKWLAGVIAEYEQGESRKPEKKDNQTESSFPSFAELFETFLAEHTVGNTNRPLAESRKRQYRVVKRSVLRYELYMTAQSGHKYSFDVRTVTTDDLNSLHDYIMRESEIYESNPDFFKTIPEKKNPPKPRCKNTMFDLFNKKLKCFFKWCIEKKYVIVDPFIGFKIDPEMYGSIYFLDWDELDLIRAKDFSFNETLQLAKDHLLLQAGVGCRVSDLMRLKKENYYDGFIRYIPIKGINDNPETVSVPVVDFVKEIIERYSSSDSPYLLPPMNPQEFNECIRYILTVAGITRNVTFLDPSTRKEITAPINKVFSSHNLRKTFVNKVFQETGGNSVLTASMTGHKSEAAFKRYRVVSDDLKAHAIKGLNINKKHQK